MKNDGNAVIVEILTIIIIKHTKENKAFTEGKVSFMSCYHATCRHRSSQNAAAHVLIFFPSIVPSLWRVGSRFESFMSSAFLIIPLTQMIQSLEHTR